MSIIGVLACRCHTHVPDIELTITYRDHTAAVNSVGHYFRTVKCFSTCIDSTLHVWDLPPPKRDTYGPVDSLLNLTTYMGHMDTVWDFRLFPICTVT
ncbi:WD40 repeat-like protein [Gigaspora margarita]|uniref:WD40 repeat-like protein n=1 Tax=Gigaspora margarita TaxID=4874 RepID=A0A8H4AV58_GIGMA|nr:WD40 repeat-like protein [Gigaspora margarita]